MPATKKRRSTTPVRSAAAQVEPVDLRAERFFELITDLGRVGSLRDPIVAIEGLDMTSPQLHAVMWLGIDGPLAMGTLAQRIHSSMPSMTGVVDRLEREGIVVRDRQTDDRRIILVRLTPKGEAIHKQARSVMIGRVQLMLSLLSDRDATALVQIIGRLREAFLRAPPAMKAESAEKS